LFLVNRPLLRTVSDIAGGLRARAHGKWLWLGDQRYAPKGVTYGPLCGSHDGLPEAEVVARDLAAAAAAGIDAVRTYTVPPRWFLDLALEHGIRVLAGIPWEEHVAFLGSARGARRVEQRIRSAVRGCAEHPAVLAWSVGNEIPAAIVRWHGPRAIERFVRRLYLAAKEESPDTLCTYVNYPTTEHLELPFLDLVCFNVFLEDRARYAAYLARLQNVAGDRPLLVTEVGLDSRSRGEETQARTLAWQVPATFEAGCAGLFVFSWTDQWHRGGCAIEDWDFGLTRRDRSPKPALSAASRGFREAAEQRGVEWPRISVVVCTYNGARTLRECLEGIQRLDYPNHEVVVVIDGSTDGSDDIVRSFPVRVIRTENHGLSHARNLGMRMATGEIIAYIDDDAYPDSLWLRRMAQSFLRTDHAGIGGPNLPPPGDGWLAQCVSNAPGNPLHVLLSDEHAEHIPGCNMAFRKRCLEEVGGFDVQYRRAGDDVDLCWRMLDRGWTLGFDPAAVVWHHRRGSIRAFWRQQTGYGEAEAMLARNWSSRHNAKGHASWSGRVYGRGQRWSFGQRPLVYGGTWGTSLFPTVYRSAPGWLASHTAMPEWHLLVLVLACASLLAFSWWPLVLAVPLFALAAGALVTQAVLGSCRAWGPRRPGVGRREHWRSLGVTAWLHLVQPLARLCGRGRGSGLRRWRELLGRARVLPRPRQIVVWSESWLAGADRLQALAARLRADRGCSVRSGGGFDSWDLEVSGGPSGGVRLASAVEEHGQGRQLVRFRVRPYVTVTTLVAVLLLACCSLLAARDAATVAAVVLGAGAAAVVLRSSLEASAASSAVLRAVRSDGERPGAK
jgi:GT2 family glycosyltransferase